MVTINLFKKALLSIGLLSSLLTSIHIQGAEPLDSIVAIVNDKAITQQELNGQTEFALQQWQAEGKPFLSEKILRTQVLNHMIDSELQRQLIASKGIKIDEIVLDKTIASIAQRNGITLDQLRGRLEQEGIPYKTYQQQIRRQLLISRLQQEELTSKITVSDQEITDMLAQMRKLPSPTQTPALYHVEDLLVPFPDGNLSSQTAAYAKQIALSLWKQAKSGTSFQQLIERSHDITPSLLLNDLGWRTLDKLPNLFEAAVLTLHPGEITSPIEAKNGFHLLRLLKTQNSNNTEATPNYVTERHVRHILIKTTPLVNDNQAEQRLREIRAEILRGRNFADLAKKYSQDPGSAYKGGDLGWTLPGLFDATFEAQINKLPLHIISLPFHTPFGWHILEVLEREKKLQTKQSILRQKAAQLVYQKKFQEALKNWLQELRNQSYVQIIPSSD